MGENYFDKYDTPAVAPAAPAAAPSSTITDTILALPRTAVEMESSLAAGVGRGVGNVALTGQDWIGKGLSLIGGGDFGGDFLQRDARQGQAKLNAEFAPYAQRNPYSAGAGKIVGEVIGTGPVVKGVAGVANAARMPNVARSIATGGMEAPNAILRGVGGGVAGATTSLLTQPEDTGLGAVVGALIPTAAVPVVNKFAKKAAEKAVPLTGQLFSAAKKLYDDMDASGARILRPVVNQLSSRMNSYITGTQRYLADSHETVNKKLTELGNLAAEPLSVTRLNEYYKSLRQAASRLGGTEGTILDDMADNVYGFFDNLTPRALGGASTRDVANLRAANELQQRAYKSKAIEDIVKKATTKGEGEASTTSVATAIQKGFQDLAGNESKMRAFTPEERKLIEKIGKGTLGTKVLNAVSTLLKPGMKLDTRALLYLLGGAANTPAAVGVAAAGAGADVWRNAMVKGQGKNVSMLIRNKGKVTPPPVRFPYPITRAGVSGAQQTKSKR